MSNKLELAWYGKNEIRVESRLLIEDIAKSTISHDPMTDNMLSKTVYNIYCNQNRHYEPDFVVETNNKISC